MSVTEIPFYAVAELLVRMSAFHAGLGEYKNHRVDQQSVMVNTTTGRMKMPTNLLVKQINTPEQVMDFELVRSAYTFQNR